MKQISDPLPSPAKQDRDRRKNRTTSRIGTDEGKIKGKQGPHIQSAEVVLSRVRFFMDSWGITRVLSVSHSSGSSVSLSILYPTVL